MKNRDSLFPKIIILAVIGIVCIALTIAAAIIIGSMDENIFDFSKLNFYNVIPVFVIGGILSCLVIGVGILFLSRDAFNKVKKYIFEEKGEDK